MKKTGLLNHRLSDVIARMGHTQRLVISDAGLPVPAGVERIDLAVSPGVPPVLDVVRAVAAELQVEAIVVADELLERDAAFADQVRAFFPGATFSSVPHSEFKRMTESAVAVVRTAEFTPYTNFILVSGVIF